ncbi:hypothetical protein INR49_022504 [Caranx melampygus]|nr:hypothetical protein INR49_022504 [Caranx melampygus]
MSASTSDLQQREGHALFIHLITFSSNFEHRPRRHGDDHCPISILLQRRHRSLVVFVGETAHNNLPQVSLTCFTSVFWTVETMSASQLQLCGFCTASTAPQTAPRNRINHRGGGGRSEWNGSRRSSDRFGTDLTRFGAVSAADWSSVMLR